MSRCLSYLLPRQEGGTSQNQINGRFLPTRFVTLYMLRHLRICYLLRVDLADEGDRAEVLEAERGELEQLQRHQRHHDVQPEETHLRRRHRRLLGLQRRLRVAALRRRVGL